MYTCLSLISLFLLFAGCSYGRREGTIQKDNISSIRFKGNVIGAVIQVDNGEKVLISDKDTDELNSFNPRQLYQVSPGKHTIKVSKDDKKVIDKTIYVGTGEIKEINIP